MDRPSTIAEMLEKTVELLDLMEIIVKNNYPDYESGTEVQDDLTELAEYFKANTVLDRTIYSGVFND